MVVILQWAWSYLTYKRGARLITDTAEQWQFIADHRGPAPPDLAARSGHDRPATLPEQPAGG